MRYNPFLIHAATREELAAELSKRGVTPGEIDRLARLDASTRIHLENLTEEEAGVLRQGMLSVGGEAIVAGQPGKANRHTAFLMSTRSQLGALLERLTERGALLHTVSAEIREVLAAPERLFERRELVCGRHVLPLGERTLIMGILNVTPDSFSDGGKFVDLDQAVARARAMVEAGADLIDIGGESTRPGSVPVDEAEELDRVLPVIRILSQELSVPLSIDTYKPEVADRAIQAGAHIINDIWGARRDRRMAEVAARHGVPIILMHNREDTDYQDFFADYVRDLRESVEIARSAGVWPDKIVLDPGIGFVKSLEQNLETMRRLDDLVALGYPVLLATSRKRMIGHVLDTPVDERVEGTAATVALGVTKGCHMVRVHDVKEMKRVAKMMDAMLRGGISVG
ncbi:dihydropteroate synthase [Brevibacillus choshinensis]|uniref:Dihydropteroate synthase n=1 Tax=Brevibacillus choshinensis TaxID=54911 RepID=A0ABX7FSC3_BRECH|nr:dihydropteroate synthase [Brevibacillus choshinensis]QRG67870.1 dihydropteroate synthase [Brevibacillus choshinensis]